MIAPTQANVRSALGFISPDLPREDWVKIGMAVKSSLNGTGLAVFDEWSKTGCNYNEHDTRDTWNSIKGDGGVTIGTLFFLAKQNGWQPDSDSHQETEVNLQKQKQKQKEWAEREAVTKTQKQQEAARKTEVLCKQAKPAQHDHPYLVKKAIKADTLLEIKTEQAIEILGYTPKSDGKPLTGRLLVVPVEINATLSTAELIDENGKKSAIAGGMKSGGYWSPQPLPTSNQQANAFFIAEGVATILSVKESLSEPEHSINYYFLAALSAGNLPKVTKYIREQYPAAEITIIADIGNGQAKAEETALAHGAKLAIPDFTGLNLGEKDTDFNDLHCLAGLGEVKRQIVEASKKQEKSNLLSLEIPSLLERSKQAGKAGGFDRKKTPDFDTPISGFPHTTENGRKRATIANLWHLFDSYGITVAYDELLKKQTIRFNNENDCGHRDLIDNAGVAHIRSLMALNGMPGSTIDLLAALFAENACNPVLDWITSKAWDDTDRLQTLADTLKVEENDRHYRNIALKTWLIQCVAAVDGAKSTPNKDALPKYELAFILQGGQGAKKTSWFKRLVPKKLGAYIIDGAHLDPADKETVRTCISSWICELGELDSTFRRADISRLKAFLSKQTDMLRLPYDRVESQFGRRTSFCGSVNPEQFLNDSTGARRFLPVQVTTCDSLHTIDMQQLWAQVWKLYLDGQEWWCSKELEEMLKERHERHRETIPVEELIAEVFHVEKTEKGFDHKHYTATRILIECNIKEPKSQQINAVNSYMKKLGFRQMQTTEGVRGYWLEKRRSWP